MTESSGEPAPAFPPGRVIDAALAIDASYKSIFDNAVVGIYQTTPDGRYIRVNAALAQMYGYDTPQELITTLTDIGTQLYVEPTRRAAFRKAMAEAGHVEDFEAAIYRRDGRVLWIKENARCVRDAHGNDLYYEGVVLDITRRRLAEENNRLLQDIFNCVSEGIVVIDRAQRVQAANPAFERITGQRRETIIGHRLGLTNTMDHAAGFLDRVCKDADRLGQWEGEAICFRTPAEPFPAWISVSVARNADGEPDKFIVVLADITQRKQHEERIRYQANFDTLTGLPNRRLLRDRLEQAILRALRSKGRVAVAFLDLDRFKQINDSLGHRAGDELLRLVARRLRNCTRISDTVGRFGGDEFILIASDIADRGAGAYLAEKIVYSFSHPFTLAGREIYCSPSIGIAFYPDDGDTAETLLRNADTAMYHARRHAPHTYALYTREMRHESAMKLDLENDLRRAVLRGEFELHYQPKVALASGRICGAEALIRWQHASLGMIAPNAFIPLAEETGIINEIGAWTVREACRQLKAWQQIGLAPPSVSVNLSPRQFQNRRIVSMIETILFESGLAPGCLELELTETAMTGDIERAVVTLTALKELGVRLSIDDFGTGYSSLSYLKRFPIDTLKIDRSFIRDLETSRTDPEIVQSIMSLARSLGFGVVAEGVETEGQARILRKRSCPCIQGYLISQPLPASAFEQFCRAWTHCPPLHNTPIGPAQT